MSMLKRDTNGRSWFLSSSEFDERHNAEEIWLFLKSALELIMESEPLRIPWTFEEIYHKTFVLVIYKHGHLLYDGLKNILNNHLENNILGKLLKTPVTEFFENVINVWRDFEQRGEFIRNLFLYVERVYFNKNSLDGVQTLVRKAFFTKILHEGEVRRRIIESARVNFINSDINDVLSSFQYNFEKFITLLEVIFEDIFQTPFSTILQEYFANEAKHLLEGNYLLDYIHLVEELYNQLYASLSKSGLQEMMKSSVIQIFLDEVITKPLQDIGGQVIQNSGGEVIQNVGGRGIQNCGVAVIQNSGGEVIQNSGGEVIQNSGGEVIQYFGAEVIQNFTMEVIENSGSEITQNFGAEVIQILESKNSSDIESLYKFCARVPMALKKLKECVQNYLVRKYESNVLSDKYFVESRLDIKKKIEDSFFTNETSKLIVIGCGFDYFLNCDQNGPQYFSAYIDKKLRENQEIGDDVIKLLFFLNQNDKFEHYYKRDLTNRLLNKAIGMDVEERIVSELGRTANVGFSFKINQMLNDVRMSESINKEFAEHQPQLNGIELNVQLLTSNIWPISSIVHKCTLSVGPRGAFESFSTFYCQKFSGRRLTLLPQLGRVDLNYNTPIQKYTIQVSTYQMMILDLFNETDEMNFETIENQTNIPRPNLIRALHGMSSGKESKQILKNNADNPNVFFINKKYYSKNSKIIIRNTGGPEDNLNVEQKRINKTVQDGRKQEIVARIVKIMKRKKVLSHPDLLVEVTQELTQRFTPQLSVFKKSVEDMIERNYLTRSPDDKNVYEYVE